MMFLRRGGELIAPSKRDAFRRARRFGFGVKDLTQFSAGYQQGGARFLWIGFALLRCLVDT
ncbi:hypothetical protein BURKHO8Y_180157 [Burkholderia sp. 8Y]|nr:hypothetical protein BURKHO8Y_180157 [Burkholderia sp. 8Y]